MCTFPSAYVDTTAKKVGDLLTASTYAFNSDGTPVTAVVYLNGYNMATSTWKTFTSTIPDSTSGWAGMPVITFTTDFIGTWNLDFSTVDKDGSSCGAGPFTLTINPTSTKMTLQSNKISITSGDTVSFYGTYLPNQNINIFIEGTVRQHVVSVKTDSTGNFVTNAVLTATSNTTYQIGACTAGSIVECSLLPDQSNYLSIDVYISTVEKWRCIGSGTGICISGTDSTYTFPDQYTCQTTAPCVTVVNPNTYSCSGTTCSPTGGTLAPGCPNTACATPTKYNCSGAPNYTCTGPFATGTYSLLSDCTTACKASGTTTGCVNCPSDLNFCISGNCINKNTVYIVGAAILLMMMK
jgi:hypothetical protein